ncbi:MAG: glycosyltransferase, partial [Eubacterium sp.]
ITDEVWNNQIHGNNVLSNWFEGFNAEFAQIYCSSGYPDNKVCKKYFQLTDMMMFKSIVGTKKAGSCIEEFSMENLELNSLEKINDKRYSRLKSMTTETLRAVREFIWCFGKYDLNKLEKFIQSFDPDIIFCPRLASLKLLRLERIVKQIANKPIVAFTGDDEYSLKQLRFSPIYWIMRFIKRYKMRMQISNYALYYTHSEDQAEVYQKTFNIPVKNLLKCGEFKKGKVHQKINNPIRLVYAGRLYCNRWKSLALIGNALKKINNEHIKMVLDIYTKDALTKKQEELLNDNKNIFLKGSVSPEKLGRIYADADIALHVESFDLKNKYLTKYSFSTKIIDCMSSGCAVLAICWDQHTGYQYLYKEDAALTIGNEKDIEVLLMKIVNDPNLIIEYAKKAYQCGMKNHQKENVQQMLLNDFKNIIGEKI